MECDARKPAEAVAESLSAVEAGDLLRAEGRDGASAGFLESFVGREETTASVPSMDAGDEGLLGPRCEAVVSRKTYLSG